jgi:hypothetical protein
MGLAGASLAVAVIGTAMSAYGQYQQGQQQSAMNNYQSAVAANNSIIASQQAAIQERAAEDALSRGRIDEQQHRLKVSQMMGSQRAALAGSGVLVDSGSGLNLLADTATMGEMDALTIRGNAEREAYNARIGAWNSTAKAGQLMSDSGMYGVAASNASSNGAWGAGTSLMSGLGQAGMNYSLLSAKTATSKSTATTNAFTGSFV